LFVKRPAQGVYFSVVKTAVGAYQDVLKWFFFSAKGNSLFLSELFCKAGVERIAGNNSDLIVKE
jgi:hypothetical protein